jgi:hypothetical protein
MFTSDIDCSFAIFKISNNFQIISEVETTLGLLAFSFHFADMNTELVAETKELKYKIGREPV